MNSPYRPMRSKDVLECVEIIAAHPVFGPRYQKRTAELREAWLRLLDCDAKTAIVFEEAEGSNPRIWGFGVSVFVRDEFIQELKTPPLVWIGPELARRVSGGDSPILTYDELRQANASEGLNLLVWDGCIRHTVKNESEGYNKMMAYFMGEHRGYRWKEVISLQSPHAEWLGAIFKIWRLILGSCHRPMGRSATDVTGRDCSRAPSDRSITRSWNEAPRRLGGQPL